MSDFGFLLILAVGGILYMIPTWIAFKVNHEDSLWIMLINIFAGWTGIAWILLLFWSLGSDKK